VNIIAAEGVRSRCRTARTHTNRFGLSLGFFLVGRLLAAAAGTFSFALSKERLGSIAGGGDSSIPPPSDGFATFVMLLVLVLFANRVRRSSSRRRRYNNLPRNGQEC
jgi:hypothetical protein